MKLVVRPQIAVKADQMPSDQVMIQTRDLRSANQAMGMASVV